MPVAPLDDLVGLQGLVLITRLHGHEHAIDVLLQAGDGRRHPTAAHILADLDIEQQEFIEVVEGLELVGHSQRLQLRVIGHYFIEVVGTECIAQGLVELTVDGCRHDSSSVGWAR